MTTRTKCDMFGRVKTVFDMKLEKFLHDISNHLTQAQLNLEIELGMTSPGNQSPESIQRIRASLSGIQKAILEVQKLKQEFLKNNQE